MGRPQPIAEMIEQYPGQWLGIRITREEHFWPVEGVLLYHEPTREALSCRISMPRDNGIFVRYAGPVIPDGHILGPMFLNIPLR